MRRLDARDLLVLALLIVILVLLLPHFGHGLHLRSPLVPR